VSEEVRRLAKGVEIGLLGPLEVRRDGRLVPLPGARARRLLAILALDANCVVPADRIAEALWAERPPATATTALHVLISRLRQALEPDRAARSAGTVIVTTPPGYELRLARGSVDALGFEDDVAVARTALAGGRWEQAATAFGVALLRWRGSALPEFADDTFASGAITRWNELRFEAEEDRVEALLALGRHAQLVSELDALVAAAPYRERRTGQLMRALYRDGRQAEALRAYERLRRLLAEELGISPGPDLQRLEREMLLQDHAVAWGPAAVSAGLVGRDSEFGALREAMAEATRGVTRVVLVSGEPGIGKTTILQSLAAEAPATGATVWWGTCAEGVGAGPYRPWIDALAAGGADWPAHSTDSGSVAADPARRRLFDAVADVLRGASAAAPLVVMLDDLQWADIPSLRLLESVVSGLRDSPLLLVGAHRDVAASGDGALAVTLARLRADSAVWCIELARLRGDAVAAIVESMTGERSPELAALVHARTGGNPLFVRELVRVLDANDALGASATAVAVPPTVRAMVDRTYSQLSTDGRDVVAAAAVAGRDLDGDRLALVADCDPVRFAAGVDDALAVGLLVRASLADGGQYRFSHDLVRESVYEGLSVIRRARLHRRIGGTLEALVERGEPVPAADLAHHFVAATRGGGDPAKAVRYAALAAEDATAALAYEDAVVQYERALEAGAAIDAAARARLQLALGDARWRAGDTVAARETFLEAVHDARDLEQPELLARAVLGFGGGFFRAWHATRGAFGDRPALLLEEALAAVGPDSETGDRVRLQGLLAEELYYTDDDRRFSLSAEAVDIARRIGDKEILAAALSSRCQAVWVPDHVEERRAIALELVEIGEAIGGRELVLFGLRCQYVAEVELGLALDADLTLAAFEAAAAERRQPIYLWEARFFRASEAIFRGRFPEAERLAVEALEMGERTEDPDALAIFSVQFGVLRLEQGRGAEVLDGLRDLAAEFEESPAWRAGLCLALAEEGLSADAAAEFDVLAQDRFASLPRDFAWLAALAMLSDACALIGDADRAAALYELLVPYADRNPMTGDRTAWGSAAHYIGQLSLVRGRFEEAVGWFERAVEANAAMRAEPWLAHSQHGLARALRRRGAPGDVDAAATLTALATRTARELGMERLLRHIREADSA
jgi:DNA-binding SARP family transcriptional activator